MHFFASPPSAFQHAVDDIAQVAGKVFLASNAFNLRPRLLAPAGFKRLERTHGRHHPRRERGIARVRGEDEVREDERGSTERACLLESKYGIQILM